MSESTLIKIEEICNIFKEYCKDEKKKFTEKKFKEFLECCERDFYQWLRDNLKYFSTE